MMQWKNNFFSNLEFLASEIVKFYDQTSVIIFLNIRKIMEKGGKA